MPGKIGRYEISAELGQGGMATVYLAHDPVFKRDVAIKVLPAEFLFDSRSQQRFQHEAQNIAALEHPAIVPVYDFGEDDGQPYLVMRYMTGGSLADQMKRGALPLEDINRIISTLAAALDTVHVRNIVHRDLKPGNVLFDQFGNPYISDFGISKPMDKRATSTASASTGTPAYISPEQARGEYEIDGRADIYSLGAMLYELLTGQLPYDGDTAMAIAIKHITEPIPLLSDKRTDLPAGLQNVINTSMAKDPAARYRTATEMARDLSRALSGETVAVSVAKPDPAPVPKPQRDTDPMTTKAAKGAPAQAAPAANQKVVIASAGALLVLALLVGAFLAFSGGAKIEGLINVDNAHLRAGPSTEFPSLGIYPRDSALTATGRTEDGVWVAVTMADGKEGWISTRVVGLEGDVNRLQVLPPP